MLGRPQRGNPEQAIRSNERHGGEPVSSVANVRCNPRVNHNLG